MNGRCHKDPLDRAEDICELCGNQFCANCVLYPRGHRNAPTCKTCALENSGLRGGGGGKSAMSKREYKKLKKQLLELLETVEEPEPALEAFDLADPSAFDTTNELDRRIEQIEQEAPIDILAANDETPPPPPSEPPVSTESGSPFRVPRSVAKPVAEEPPTNDDDFGPVDTSVNPLAIDFGERPASAPRHAPEEQSAADLLARLKADQPIESQFSPPGQRPATPGPAFAADPFAQPEASSRPPASPPASIDDPFATTGPASDPFTSPAAAPSMPQATPSPAPAPSPSSSQTAPATAAWTPPAPPPRGSNLDAMAGGPAPGEHPPAPAAAVAADPPPVPTPATPVPAEAAPAQEERRADTDAAGQWIPPSLRGMAAPEERDPLPKRR